jgi:membrane protein
MASAIAYRVLFAIVPLTMFIVSVLGLLAGTSDRQDDLSNDIIDYLDVDTGEMLTLSKDGEQRIADEYDSETAAAVSDALDSLTSEEASSLSDELEAGESVEVAGIELTSDDVGKDDNLVHETIRDVVNASGPIGVVSFLVLAYSASGLFGSVRRSLDFVWGVRYARPLFQGTAVDLAMLAFTLGIFILSVFFIGLTGALRAIGEAHEGWFGFIASNSWVWGAFTFSLSWVTTLAICIAAFRFVPQPRVHLRDVWLGAIVTATGFEVLKFGFSIYIARFNTYDLVYGTLGGVLLFLLIVYWAAYVFLLGAETASKYPRLRAGEFDVRQTPTSGERTVGQRMREVLKGLFVRKKLE